MLFIVIDVKAIFYCYYLVECLCNLFILFYFIPILFHFILILFYCKKLSSSYTVIIAITFKLNDK